MMVRLLILDGRVEAMMMEMMERRNAQARRK
jgi:hypothetical protein